MRFLTLLFFLIGINVQAQTLGQIETSLGFGGERWQYYTSSFYVKDKLLPETQVVIKIDTHPLPAELEQYIGYMLTDHYCSFQELLEIIKASYSKIKHKGRKVL